jgi:hypothetical protein
MRLSSAFKFGCCEEEAEAEEGLEGGLEGGRRRGGARCERERWKTWALTERLFWGKGVRR